MVYLAENSLLGKDYPVLAQARGLGQEVPVAVTVFHQDPLKGRDSAICLCGLDHL